MLNQPSNRIAYLDTFSGISGDMFLGALIHAGLDEDLLMQELTKLGLHDAHIKISDSSSQSIACKKVTISEQRRQELRTLPSILEIIHNSGLDPEIQLKAAAVLQLLAEAEARVHGMDVNRVHFHEIGALDTIFDIVGVIIGLHHLGISRLHCSPLPLGRGFVDCAHGRLPLPAPAVSEILRDIPCYGVDIEQELVTPTGAALVSLLADEFGPIPPMSITATGYGGGNHTLPNNQPNLLRLLIGHAQDVIESQKVDVLDTRLDDWNPEGFQHLCDRLLSEGALDVSLIPCQGKKGRPGFHLQVLCSHVHRIALQNLILSETTALGLRCRTEERRTLPRRPVTLQTQWGELTAKEVQTPRGTILYPEYEECRKMAVDHGLAIDTVYRAVYAHKSK